MCQKHPLTSTNHAISYYFIKKAFVLYSIISVSYNQRLNVDGALSACLSDPRHDLDAGRFAAVGKNSDQWLVTSDR
jgi:hypothetical protein